MGERVEIINEHWSRAMLERDNLDYSKFYRRQIEEFLDVSRKDTKKYKELYELEKAKNIKVKEILKSYMDQIPLNKDDKAFELLDILEAGDKE